MGLNDTPSGERTHIGFFGVRNAGKSSLVNAVTGQDISVVSDVKGTTTDAVKKAMELLPLGPVEIIDTPGMDDCGALGEKRVAAAEKVLRRCDIAVLVTVAGTPRSEAETDLISLFGQKKIPFVIAANKADLLAAVPENEDNIVYVSAREKAGIEALKNKIGALLSSRIFRHVWYPSIPGIIISRIIRSYSLFSNISNALTPFPAVSTRYPSPPSNTCIISRISGLSSTTKILELFSSKSICLSKIIS